MDEVYSSEAPLSRKWKSPEAFRFRALINQDICHCSMGMTPFAVGRAIFYLVATPTDLVRCFFKRLRLLTVMTPMAGAGEDTVMVARLTFDPVSGMFGMGVDNISGINLEPDIDRPAIGRRRVNE